MPLSLNEIRDRARAFAREWEGETSAFRFIDRSHRIAFFDELTGIIDDSNFILISCLIDKRRLRERDQVEGNPYHLALGFCLETL